MGGSNDRVNLSQNKSVDVDIHDGCPCIVIADISGDHSLYVVFVTSMLLIFSVSSLLNTYEKV